MTTQVPQQMIAGGPAFSAYLTTTQNISSGSFTLVQLNSVANPGFDTNGNFNTSTYSFKPTVAGYYQINGAVNCGASSGQNRVIAFIYKSGIFYAQGTDSVPYAASGGESTVSTLLYLNGSTDTVQLYTYILATTAAISQGSGYTYLSGSLVRTT